MKTKHFAVAALFLLSAAAYAQTYENPVIRGVADAGCIRYAGKYYLGGVATYGDFYQSTDLVHWGNKIHAFDLNNDWTAGTGAKNNQIHANDMLYHGGLFHLLFSVNWWGKDKHIVHITHATSPTVEGPYKEVRSDQWYENRIDPMVFCDEDGQLYLYMVKFTDGNTIWGRKLNKDFSFAGEPVQQFSSQPASWERMDNRVAEGPFVIKYRGRYYMMYNANHTGIEYGNYRLGVCEAPSPLTFNPGGKYSHPVVEPNIVKLLDDHVDLLRYGSAHYRPLDLSKDTISFELSSRPTGKLMMFVRQRGTKIYINDHLINANHGHNYGLLPVPVNFVKAGTNVLRFERGERSAVYGVELLSYRKDEPVEDILLTPGQPNIVRGPNGWEWWLVYMVNKNGWNRDQYIDRVHFSCDRLTVDGITSALSQGYHPAPASPLYSGKSIDSINFTDSYLLEATFACQDHHEGFRFGNVDITLPDSFALNVPHEWRIEKNHQLLSVWIDQVLVANHLQLGTTPVSSPTLLRPANFRPDYLSFTPGYDEYGRHFSGWEGASPSDEGLKLQKSSIFKGNKAKAFAFSVQMAPTAPAGLYAAYQDEKNFVRMVIDNTKRTLTIEKMKKGKLKSSTYPLTRRQDWYPDIKYSDNFEKQYRLPSLSTLSAILLPKTDPDDADSYTENIVATQQVEYLDHDTWKPLAFQTGESKHPGWQKITFAPIQTQAVRFINSDPEDGQRHLYRVKADIDSQTSYQLRVDRRNGMLHLFLNETEVEAIDTRWMGSTQVGLFAKGEALVRDAFYYEINER
ncbi:MAG: family 43 glycosylhydrolase [Prevotella sp.]|jgi:GH43 family beta-xylosidase